MSTAAAEQVFDDLVTYTSGLTGEAAPGVSWAAYGMFLAKNRSLLIHDLAQLVRPAVGVVEGPLGSVPSEQNYDSWSEKKRRDANLDALRVLRRMQSEGRMAPTPEEQAYLFAYTGWGGVNPAKLPEDPVLFPEDYVEGIRQWRQAAEKAMVPTSNVFRGLRHQFFTPLDVCEAMWGLARRVAPVGLHDALEPSAGIGRMLQTTPEDLQVAWTTVEYDPLLAELLQAAHPEAEVYVSAFESFFRDAEASGRQFDLILSNPPYPDRPERDRRLDPEGAGWSKAHCYFTERASRLLRPGGVLVTITPAGEIIGNDTENRRLREWLFSRCHFSAAVFPPSDIFPYVNPAFNAFAIHAWVRLAPGTVVQDDEERHAILEGRYLETPAGQENTLGAWVEAAEGKLSVKGVFDPAEVVNCEIRQLPVLELAAIRRWREAAQDDPAPNAPTPADPYAAVPPPAPPGVLPSPVIESGEAIPVRASAVRMPDFSTMTRADADALDAALVLAYRLFRFQGLALKGGRDAVKAETGREELLTDVQDFVAKYGNPHRIPDVVARGAETAALLAAVSARGEYAPLLVKQFAPRELDAPGPDATPGDVVLHYSRRYGVCTSLNLIHHFGVEGADAAFQTLVRNPAVAIEAQHDGVVWYYRLLGEPYEYVKRDTATGEPVLDEGGNPIVIRGVTTPEYLAGDLVRRLESLEAWLANEPDANVRAKLDEQRAALALVMGSRGLSEIKPTPRSGFVPVECLQAFANSHLRTIYNLNTPAVELAIESARLVANTRGTLTVGDTPVTAQVEWLRFLLGYWNRETMAVDPDQKDAGRANIYAQGSDLEERMRAEALLERTFQTWLAGSDEWRDVVVDAYNKVYTNFREREYDGSDLGIPRMSPMFVPGAHQNAAVRRFTEKRGGILQHAVGGGKTASGLLTAAYWRQIGRARRPLIIVPNNVIFNWYREARVKVLPDYRVGIIGFTIDAEQGTTRADTSEERRVKWLRYANGDYDLLLCPYSNFLDDVEMKNESILEILSSIFWLQRQLGVDAEERKLYQRKIEELREKIKGRKQDIVRLRDRLSYTYGEGAKNKVLEAIEAKERINGTDEEKILKYEAVIKEPPKGIIAEVQQQLDDISEKRPFRPRIKPSADWKRGWSKARLISFASARGIGIEDDGAVTMWPWYEAPSWAADEVQAERAQAMEHGQPIRVVQAPETGASKKKRGRATGISKAGIQEILEIYFPAPPPGPPGPKPALVQWEQLDCDCLIVDEAHNYKNVWYAQPRLGEKSIEYMGGTSEEMGTRTWDMFLKCQYLLRQHDDGGVILLTATVLKNSPMEIYNLLSLVSTKVWTQRQVRSSEEFIDRYCDLENGFTTSVDLGGENSLMVTGMLKNGAELLSIMNQYIENKTTGDLLRAGVIKSVPLPRIRHVELPLDATQDRLYDAVSEFIQEIEEEAKGADKNDPIQKQLGALRLLSLDLYSKIALDPRLLEDDVEKIEKLLAKDAKNTKAYAAWEKGGRKGREPSAPLNDRYREFLDRRYELLTERLDAQNLRQVYEGVILPKYRALAEHVLRNPDCGHIVFADYNDTHEAIADAIVQVAGIKRERIAIMTGALDPEERQDMAEDFNGRDAIMDPDTGKIEQEPEIYPAYDIIIGNSAVMAEGVNLQRRTCAIHHLTYPWEPATLTQRNGRGVRQGNQLETVEVRYYLAAQSFDGFKLNKIMGKSAWQHTVWEPDARSTDNPLAGSKISRTEMLLLTLRKDPERARELAAEMERKGYEMRIARARNAARDRFIEVVETYVKARAEARDVSKAALFAQGDALAESLRMVSDDIFPNKLVLDVAREKVVYYDPDTNMYLAQGERVCAIAANAETGEPYSDPRRFMVLAVSERGTFFRVRDFGSPYIRNEYSAAGLLGKRLPENAVVERLDLASCGGWSTAEEDALILDSTDTAASSAPNMSADIITRLEGRLWPALVQRARSQTDITALFTRTDITLKLHIPLINSAGEILLVSAKSVMGIARSGVAWNQASAEKIQSFLLERQPLYPQLPEAWSTFSDAVQQDRVFVLSEQGDLTIDPLPYGDDRRLEVLLYNVALQWFNRARGVHKAVLKEGARRHAKKQGLLVEGDEEVGSEGKARSKRALSKAHG